MTEGLASEVPEALPFLRAVYIVLKRRMSGKLHMLSDFLTPRKIYQLLSLSLLGFSRSTRNCPAIAA